jgi:quercetin dioxygenase-like cupin family protein
VFRSGDVIANPLTGVRLVFRRTAAETGGAAVVFEAFLAPNGHVPPERVHPHQELQLEVLAGSVGTSVGGRRAVAGPGTRVVVPAGTPGRVWNAGDDVAHLVAEVAPALGFEPLVEATVALAAAAHAKGRFRPGLLERAAVAAAHFETARPAFPPAPLQRLGLAVAALLGRALGRGAAPSPTLPGAVRRTP